MPLLSVDGTKSQQAENLSRAWAVFRILRERLMNDQRHGVGNVRIQLLDGDRHHSSNVAGERFPIDAFGSVSEWVPPSEELICDDAHRKDVCSLRNNIARGLLRGHVERSAAGIGHSSDGTQAKIEDLRCHEVAV